MAVTAELRKFNTGKSTSGDELFALNAPMYVDLKVLAANVVETFTIPTGANAVLFSPADKTSNFEVRYDSAAAATYPEAGDVSDGTAWWPNPGMMLLDKGYTQIHVVAPLACRVKALFGRIQTR